MKTIGVVIRTLNEAELLGTCLETLARQQTPYALDILVVDSGSTDATLDIARGYGARIHEISPENFDYSKALNIGIERVGGDLVLILSAHAIPVDDRWVARMIAPFADPQIAGVASRQIPWHGAPWREVLRIAREFPETSEIFTHTNADQILFSNAVSCIRRSAWLEEPFTLPAAEDLEWAQRVVAGGWSVAYAGDAPAYHSHDEGPRELARRLIDINVVESPDRRRAKTLREAARLLYTDLSSIVGLDEPIRRKLAHFAALMKMVSFYVVDFSRAGTTAERRRQDVTKIA
jgi:glycosyltransferase involved in cell wall biosynthesis